MNELSERIKAHRAAVAALSERDAALYKLAHKAVSSMGFACQGAAQQNEAMEVRYERVSEAALAEFDRILLDLPPTIL